MFSIKEKQFLASEIEKLILGLNHPEMPKEKPGFKLHVDGKESWSWADIEPNWKYDGKPNPNSWNEIARDVLSCEEGGE
jgi:carbonic anhydrase